MAPQKPCLAVKTDLILYRVCTCGVYSIRTGSLACGELPVLRLFSMPEYSSTENEVYTGNTNRLMENRVLIEHW